MLHEQGEGALPLLCGENAAEDVEVFDCVHLEESGCVGGGEILSHVLLEEVNNINIGVDTQHTLRRGGDTFCRDRREEVHCGVLRLPVALRVL